MWFLVFLKYCGITQLNQQLWTVLWDFKTFFRKLIASCWNSMRATRCVRYDLTLKSIPLLYPKVVRDMLKTIETWICSYKKAENSLSSTTFKLSISLHNDLSYLRRTPRSYPGCGSSWGCSSEQWEHGDAVPTVQGTEWTAVRPLRVSHEVNSKH